jgi:hypothetical protein
MEVSKTPLLTRPLESALLILLGGALFITPFLMVSEIYQMYDTENGLVSLAELHTPLEIKLMKDVFFVLLLGCGLFLLISKKKVTLPRPAIYLFAIFSASFLISLNHQYSITLLAGLRWILPLFFFLLFYQMPYKTIRSFQVGVFKLLTPLFWLGFSMQLHQIFYMNYYLSAGQLRNPAFFTSPGAFAIFGLIYGFYTVFFAKSPRYRLLIFFVILPLSIKLTASGTGIIAYFFLLFTSFTSKIKYKGLYFSVLTLITFSILPYLPEITMRPTILKSLFDRIETFYVVVTTSEVNWLSQNFGVATNSNTLFFRTFYHHDFFDDLRIYDSNVLAVLVNLGYLGFFSFTYFIAKAYTKKIIYYHYLIIFILPMLTNIVFDIFPINILFALCTAYLYRFKENDCQKELACPQSASQS